MADELKRVVFCWGRMNPPHIGHEKMIEFTKERALYDPWYVMVTHSEGGRKNPLPYDRKIYYLKKMFPDYAKNIYEGPASQTIIKVMQYLQPDYDHVVAVVGDDQFPWLSSMLPKQNGTQDYTFDKIEVLNAGKRKKGATGAEGASSTLIKEHAEKVETRAFYSMLPDKLSISQKSDLMAEVRKGMGL